MPTQVQSVYTLRQASEQTGLEESRIRFYEAQFRDLFRARGVDLSARHFDATRLALLKDIDRRFGERQAPDAIRSALLGQGTAGRGQRVITVTSGKGGVGKTTVSINLAVSLARSGYRTLLFDADLGLANVHVYAGLNPKGTLVDVVTGRASLEEVLTAGPSGVQVVCGDTGVAKVADMEQQMVGYLGREMRRMSDRFDFILIDTAAGISKQVVEFLKLADEIVVVATPNLAATLDAYSVIKVAHHHQLASRAGLLVNMVRSRSEAWSVHERIAACAGKFLGFEPELFGHLKRDSLVEKSNMGREPLVLSHPGSANAKRFADLAARFEPVGEEATGETKKRRCSIAQPVA